MQRLFYLMLLFVCSTGSVMKDPSTSIINGDIVNIEDCPYFAHLTFIDGGALLCGGAIIKEDIILTAAHCLDKMNFHVYVGISTIVETILMDPFSVKEIIPYFKFKELRLTMYDIGLVRLNDKITLGPTIDVIDIPSSYPPVGAKVGILGFGHETCDYDYGSCNTRFSVFLKFAVAEIIKIKNGVIYTLGENKNTCYGDSGGPVVYDNKVIAVVSSGQNADCTGYDTQTPVAPYYFWIKKYMTEEK